MTKNRLIVTIVIIAIIILGVLYFKAKNEEIKGYQGPENTGICGANGEFCPGTPGYKERMKQEQEKTKEESPDEIFNYQPGEVKSVTNKGSESWVVSVDLLTPNPNWVPGVDSTGGPFINQNPKLRSLNVTSVTKAYTCGDGQQTDFPEDLQVFMQKLKNENYKTRYFDIVGSDVTRIYQQCLP